MQVVGQSHRERLDVCRSALLDPHIGQSGSLNGEPSATSANDLIVIGYATNNNWLNLPPAKDRGGKCIKRRGVVPSFIMTVRKLQARYGQQNPLSSPTDAVMVVSRLLVVFLWAGAEALDHRSSFLLKTPGSSVDPCDTVGITGNVESSITWRVVEDCALTTGQ